MINNNNNFSGISSMSASVYYGDGQYLTGVSGGATGSNGTSGTSGNNGSDGDRYHTTSSSSLTLNSSGTASIITDDLYLDYSIGQTIIIAYDLNHHQHGSVISYDQSTGVLVFDKTNKTGTGTYTSWDVNLDGAVGVAGTSGTSGTSQTAAGSFGITVDGGGSVIPTGLRGFVVIPYSGTITEWTIIADQSGSAVVDIWKSTYAGAPPTIANTITASAKPTLTASQKAQSSTLTGWTTSVTTGDVIGFNVDSASTVTRLNLSIKITKS
jgi:hypothetical protein